MGILSRGTLVLFILCTIDFLIQDRPVKAVDAWTMSIILTGLAMLFVFLGAHEENA